MCGCGLPPAMTGSPQEKSIPESIMDLSSITNTPVSACSACMAHGHCRHPPCLAAILVPVWQPMCLSTSEGHSNPAGPWGAAPRPSPGGAGRGGSCSPAHASRNNQASHGNSTNKFTTVNLQYTLHNYLSLYDNFPKFPTKQFPKPDPEAAAPTTRRPPRSPARIT